MLCTQCGHTKTPPDFYLTRGKYMNICKVCQMERVKQSRINVRTKKRNDSLFGIIHRMDATHRAIAASIYQSRVALGLSMITADELAEALGLTPNK